MAKTESTAVNELIDLVQNNKQPAQPDPGADLFASPAAATSDRAPAAADGSVASRLQPSRLTSPVPALRGAGEVEPLPRGRAPHSTSQLRMSTADPERGNTIPPLSQPVPPPRKTPRSSGAVQALRSSSPPPIPSRPSQVPTQPHERRASAPPPLPGQRASTSALARVATQMAAQRSPSEELAAQRVLPLPAHELPPWPAPEVSAGASVGGSAGGVDLDHTPLPPPYEPSPLPGPLPTPMPFDAIQRAMVPSMPSLPPPSAPVAAPFEPGRRPATQPGARPLSRQLAAVALPQQYPVISRAKSVDATGDVVRAEQWFELSAPVPKLLRKAERSEGTAVVARQDGGTVALIKKLIVPGVLAAIIGVVIGGYFALHAKNDKKSDAAAAVIAPQDSARIEMPVVPSAAPPTPAASTAPVAPAVPAQEVVPPSVEAAAPAMPAAEPTERVAATAAPSTGAVVREVETPRGVVQLVDVRIDSTPSGATVMLVDNGKTSFLGSTPLATSLDPSRKYDVIFMLPGRPTQMAPLDPSTSTKLEVTLARGKSHSSKRAKVVAEAPQPEAARREASKPEASKPEASKPAAAKADKMVDAKAASAAGEGTLMVSSKPPCELIIDGKPTGLTTPQRAISLSAGTHKVTFVNAPAGIQKTVSVSISADKPTKLIEDLMKK